MDLQCLLQVGDEHAVGVLIAVCHDKLGAVGFVLFTLPLHAIEIFLVVDPGRRFSGS